MEFCKGHTVKDDGGVRFFDVNVDDKMSKKLRRPRGRYTTLETSAVLSGNAEAYHRVSDALGKCIREYLKGCDKVMAVGLGNPDLTADALGDRVFKRLAVNRHLNSERYLCALTPNVLGMTGIESYDIISSVVERIKPDAVIAIDSLTAAAASRIASAFQVTDSGITPGSGVENHRQRLDSDSLGVRVISVGVPLVVYSSTIAKDYCGSDGSHDTDMIVTPKDVDILVEDCAKIIASAINSAFSSKQAR